MSTFLEQMAAHVLKRRFQQLGVQVPEGSPEPYVRRLLHASPVFADCPEATIYNVRTRRPARCSQREVLVDTLAEIFVRRGLIYAQFIESQAFEMHAQVGQGCRMIHRALKTFYPERRHKKLWRAYGTVIAALDRIAPEKYARLQQDLRLWKNSWYESTVCQLFQAFRAHGPGPREYPNVATAYAIAALFLHLDIAGSNSVESLAKRVDRWHKSALRQGD